MLKIKTWRNPYDAGFSTTRPKEIELKEGLTVLVGCNGAGKSTLLRNIKDACKNENIPVLYYDNLNHGGGNSLGEAISSGDYSFGAALFSSSEGESIKLNFGNLASKVRKFLATGFYDTKQNRLARIFREAVRDHSEKKEEVKDNRRVLLLDAIDSGLSVDSVCEVREVFNLVLEDASALSLEVYIVVSANEYELARQASCFDVAAGRYVELSDYESYRKFILESRRKKDARLKSAEKKNKRI